MSAGAQEAGIERARIATPSSLRSNPIIPDNRCAASRVPRRRLSIACGGIEAGASSMSQPKRIMMVKLFNPQRTTAYRASARLGNVQPHQGEYATVRYINNCGKR
jgi:hypothetical protein